MDLAPVPVGEFVMGAAEEETGRIKGDFKAWAPEGPQHRVKITRPFWMGATHVTMAQYRKFLADCKHQPEDKQWDKIEYQTDEHPVTNVTWNDAAAFCKWLSDKESRKYRLPTEAEWEYACRAGSQTAFFFGDDPAAMGRYAWFKGNSEGKTHPVRTQLPNKWGLYDMHGLAYQWTADWFAPDYYQKSPEKDPQGPGPTIGGERKEPSKVMRGGEWWYDAWHCRSASRKDRTPNYAARTGFRVVRE